MLRLFLCLIKVTFIASVMLENSNKITANEFGLNNALDGCSILSEMLQVQAIKIAHELWNGRDRHYDFFF